MPDASTTDPFACLRPRPPWHAETMLVGDRVSLRGFDFPDQVVEIVDRRPRGERLELDVKRVER